MKETRKSSKLARVETSQNGFSRGTAHLWDRFPATSFDNGTFSMEIDERQNHCRVEETWWLSFDSMLEFAFQTIHEESNFPEFGEDLFPYCLEIRILFKMLLSNIGIIECYAFTLILYSNKVSSVLKKKSSISKILFSNHLSYKSKKDYSFIPQRRHFPNNLNGGAVLFKKTLSIPRRMKKASHLVYYTPSPLIPHSKWRVWSSELLKCFIVTPRRRRRRWTSTKGSKSIRNWNRNPFARRLRARRRLRCTCEHEKKRARVFWAFFFARSASMVINSGERLYRMGFCNEGFFLLNVWVWWEKD